MGPEACRWRQLVKKMWLFLSQPQEVKLTPSLCQVSSLNQSVSGRNGCSGRPCQVKRSESRGPGQTAKAVSAFFTLTCLRIWASHDYSAASYMMFILCVGCSKVSKWNELADSYSDTFGFLLLERVHYVNMHIGRLVDLDEFSVWRVFFMLDFYSHI